MNKDREDEDKYIEDEEDKYNLDYEDEYVYGDSDELDEDKYIKPREEEYVSKYREQFEEDEEEEDVEIKESLEEKVDRRLNKTLDFFESKQFSALQWSIAVGALVLMWGVIYLVSSAGDNVRENAIHQEKSRSSFVAKDLAPEEYTSFEEDEAKRRKQQEDMDSYLEEKSKSYEEQKEELGELPEGYTEIMDIDGNVSYLSPEEYEKYLEDDIRTPDAEREDEEESDSLEGITVEIVPADEEIWDLIAFGDINNLEEGEVYQTRGEFIYFAQRAISLKFPYNIVDTDFDSETFILTIKENPYADTELPKDFEDRMNYAFNQSGYGINNKGDLEIIYEEADI